ncbi:hypothetical protein [Allopusillimonas ginsengisoli]|uniref:hypothetical protein n=1 Tax=Allopusillimonas ginsengisoli TaxID=453575 RepID=UPI0014317446|nr:hypothetical protein [Allopusillimonas ginsengisoli]
MLRDINLEVSKGEIILFLGADPSILNLMRDWANERTGILLVEQYADLALPLADRVIVMRGGEIILSCEAHELSSSSQLREAYLGVSWGWARVPRVLSMGNGLAKEIKLSDLEANRIDPTSKTHSIPTEWHWKIPGESWQVNPLPSNRITPRGGAA